MSDLESFLTELARGDLPPSEVARLYTTRLLETGLSPDEAARMAHERLVRPWRARGVESDLQAGVNAAAGTHRERMADTLTTALDVARACSLRGEPWVGYMRACMPKGLGTAAKKVWRTMVAEIAPEFGATVERPVDPRPRNTSDRIRERDARRGGRS